MIAEKTKKILSECLMVPLEDIQDDTNIVKSFGTDSLTLVEVSMRLEDEFNVHLQDVPLTNLLVVSEIVELITCRRNL